MGFLFLAGKNWYDFWMTQKRRSQERSERELTLLHLKDKPRNRASCFHHDLPRLGASCSYSTAGRSFSRLLRSRSERSPERNRDRGREPSGYACALFEHITYARINMLICIVLLIVDVENVEWPLFGPYKLQRSSWTVKKWSYPTHRINAHLLVVVSQDFGIDQVC
jgi:hypothetical protein